jgi:hypothetical protein
MDTPNHHPYLLFRQTPQQLRRVGARGGKAAARNRRTRLDAAALPTPPVTPPVEPYATAVSAAIAALDAQFPWLRGAENRFRPIRRMPVCGAE